MRQNRFATHQITYPIWLSPFPFLRPLHKAHTSRFYTQKDTIARGSKQFSFYLSSRWALHSKLVCSKDFYRISTLQHAFEIFQYLKKGSKGERRKFSTLSRIWFVVEIRIWWNSWDWNYWYLACCSLASESSLWQHFIGNDEQLQLSVHHLPIVVMSVSE